MFINLAMSQSSFTTGKQFTRGLPVTEKPVIGWEQAENNVDWSKQYLCVFIGWWQAIIRAQHQRAFQVGDHSAYSVYSRIMSINAAYAKHQAPFLTMHLPPSTSISTCITTPVQTNENVSVRVNGPVSPSLYSSAFYWIKHQINSQSVTG